MPFLSVNGVALPVELDSVDESEREVGGPIIAQSGSLRQSRQALKRDVTLDTVPIVQDEVRIWEKLIAGEGEGWDLVTFYSSKGTPLSFTGGATVSGVLTIPAAVTPGTATLAYGFPTGSAWTVFTRRTVAGVFDGNYIVRSDGAKWLDGVRADGTSTTWLSASATSAILTGLTTDETSFFGFWAFPDILPQSWIDGGMYTAFGFGATFYSPRLYLTGTLIREASSRIALGTVESNTAVRGYKDGALRRNMRRLRVKLNEA